jgi:hypothetical protein
MHGRPATMLSLLAAFACRPAPTPSVTADVEAHEPADDDLAIDADSGTAIGSAGVWVIARWRSTVVPRALLIVIPRADQSPSSLAAFANRALDERFMHAVVESTQPLTQQIKLSTAIAGDKALAHRQALDAGRPPTPTITALLIDSRHADEDEALAALRAGAAHAVEAAIVLSEAGERRREVVEREWSVKLDVLMLPSPRDANDAATWAEIVGFIDDVAHARNLEPAGDAQGSR